MAIRDLSNLMGISYSSMAEIVKKLAPPGRRFGEAAGIIEVVPDLMDERRKLLRLSIKGKGVLQRIHLINEPAPNRGRT